MHSDNARFAVNDSFEHKIAVVIPCYKVSKQLPGVIGNIGSEVSAIYCIDDACPQKSAQKAAESSTDSRLKVIQRTENGGVGAAVLTGYAAAIADGATIIVKLDGDGQMDPAFIPQLIRPILDAQADYVKGNRFYHLNSLKSMPRLRVLGNAGLSFLTKTSSGYWNLFDPTNGFTAIHSEVAKELDFERIHPRFFFESDMLFRLNLLRAVIQEVPMDAAYSDEKSNLNPWKSLLEFPVYNFKNFLKRLFYNYFLRNFSLASINLLLGLILCVFGTVFGLINWNVNAVRGIPATSGTVMVSALPIIIGFQMLIGFLAYDMSNVPSSPIHHRLGFYKKLKKNHDKQQ